MPRHREEIMIYRTLILGALTTAGVAAAVALAGGPPPVSGVFRGNGADARLAYALAVRGEPYMDKPTIELIFTEKDASKASAPDVNASMGDFGSALIVTATESGEIVGCDVAHANLPKSPFSAIGRLHLSDFKLADGVVSGKLSTAGEVESLGQKWEVSLTFRTSTP
jgi:hypothetical protein